MSGVDLLFRTATDYERTHQLALYTLLKESNLAESLNFCDRLSGVEWEPEGGLFDLAITGGAPNVYIEIKMWSPLSGSQLERQSGFLTAGDSLGVYVLLGASWFEYDHEDIVEKTGNHAVKVGYDELTKCLNDVITSANNNPDVLELALSYRIALEKQWAKIVASCENGGSETGRLYWYSLYHRIKQLLGESSASIGTVNNPGGEVYLLSSKDWITIKHKGIEIELYCEVVDGVLCIKFHPYTDNNEVKRDIRNDIRKSIHAVLDGKYDISDKGRMGEYMTACQINHDFSNIEKVAVSAHVFDDVCLRMNDIAKQIVAL